MLSDHKVLLVKQVPWDRKDLLVRLVQQALLVLKDLKAKKVILVLRVQ